MITAFMSRRFRSKSAHDADYMSFLGESQSADAVRAARAEPATAIGRGGGAGQVEKGA